MFSSGAYITCFSMSGIRHEWDAGINYVQGLPVVLLQCLYNMMQIAMPIIIAALPRLIARISVILESDCLRGTRDWFLGSIRAQEEC